MATQNWLGTATAVKQVATGAIASVDATPSNNTFTVTIGGVAVSVAGVTNANATAAALVAALSASTHPYFTAVVWTNPSGANVVGTAAVAGVPFVAVISKTGAGTGTVTAFAATTASSGPNDWSTAANWDTNTIPANGDDVYLKSNSTNICWGLAQSGVTLNSLTISKTFTGKLGLNQSVFATSSDGATSSATAEAEYRQRYLQISSTTPIKIMENASVIGTALGSSRIMIDVGSVANQVIEILGSAASASENGKAAIRILANSNTCDIFVRSAPGGVGIAMDLPGETSLIRNLYITDTSTATNVVAGNGVTMTKWDQSGGQNLLQAAATVPTVNVKGGTLQCEGSYIITTCNVYSGGTLKSNNYGSPAHTTLNLYGGTADFTGSGRARTVTTLTYQQGSDAALKADMSILTVTTLNPPSTRFTLTAS